MFVAHWYQYNVCLFLVFSHALVAPTQNMRVFLNSPKYISLCLGPITTGWSSATVFYDFSFTDSKRQLTAKLNHFQRRRIGTVWYFDVSKELSWLSFFKRAQMAQMVTKCSCVLFLAQNQNFLHNLENLRRHCKKWFFIHQIILTQKIAMCPYIMSLKMDWFHSLLPFLSLSQRIKNTIKAGGSTAICKICEWVIPLRLLRLLEHLAVLIKESCTWSPCSTIVVCRTYIQIVSKQFWQGDTDLVYSLLFGLWILHLIVLYWVY